ncbi:transglycosylase SLT domain-containing protein [Gracilibacillus sp. S3-1-1]|uniref:Transglycosylase SLT domain-containing protein n=1 Tax=Gracilibacillus pellucidus TaxID=3095368 RepID=A0ACC6M4S8_9BACI|nr:transglycosylase SLT domain-containing protein [Gracilibacillus sp. S3-1-1]MDX8045969.1 transglycosylase SLT domain-containing protein [Gracilibacillus sp. S3-1-1]
MSKRIQWLNIVLVTVLVCWSYYQINSYKSEVQALEKDNAELEQALQSIETQTQYIISKWNKNNTEINHETWPKYFEIAEVMVEESDGQFLRPWAIYLVKEAENYGIDPFIVYELLKIETGKTFDTELVGPETKYGHAYGMAQFMKNTAPWIADMAELPYKDELLFDPYYSIKLSLVYLDYLYDQYDNWDETLTAYNRGMSGLEQFKMENGHASSEYAMRIQRNARKYEKHVALAN